MIPRFGKAMVIQIRMRPRGYIDSFKIAKIPFGSWIIILCLLLDDDMFAGRCARGHESAILPLD